MATEKQISANRANAQKSTGPKTTAGRAAVHLNALRHGLAAESVVVESEDKAQFEETRAAFEAEHNPIGPTDPVGPTENLLLQQMVVAAWRLRRTRAMSAGFIENAMGEAQIRQFGEFDNPAMSVRLGFVAAGHADRLDLLARCEGRIERSFYRALHELERLRTARAGHDSSADSFLPNKPNSPLPPGDEIGGTSRRLQVVVDRRPSEDARHREVRNRGVLGGAREAPHQNVLREQAPSRNPGLNGDAAPAKPAVARAQQRIGLEAPPRGLHVGRRRSSHHHCAPAPQLTRTLLGSRRQRAA